MFVTMSATKSATNMTENATNATKSATDATKPATDNATKDGGKADNITVKTKRKFGGNGGNTENITAKIKERLGKVGGNGGKVGGNGGINTDESVGYEADIIRYVRLHPNATQRSIHTAIGVPLRTIQRTMSQLQKKGILIRKGSRRLGQWKVID